MQKFSLKSLMAIFVILTLAISLAVTRYELTETSRQIEQYHRDMRHLSIADGDAINAISIPGFGLNNWRWRIHLPENKRFELCWKFDRIPVDGRPESGHMGSTFPLPTGESILSASLIERDGEWQVAIYSEVDGESSHQTVVDIPSKNAEWLNKAVSKTKSKAGTFHTEEGPPDRPYVLLFYRSSNPPHSLGPRGVHLEPTDGVLIWIQEN